MVYGTVMFWDNLKGYGFIATDDDEEYFVHINDLHITLENGLKEGESVKFDTRSDIKGDKAINVRLA